MIPDFQTLMLPLLRYLSDGEVHRTKDAVDYLASEFKLTKDELNEWLPSKRQKTFTNRVHWAKAYLKMAAAVDNVGRGLFKIAANGKNILNDSVSSISIKYLSEKFPPFKNYITSVKKDAYKISFNAEGMESKDYNFEETPEEQIESGYKKIRESLEQEILSKLKSIHPSFFERIVVELLVKMGYGGSIAEAGQATRYTNDEGIDGIIKEDKLGLDTIYIQAKRWEGTVGRPELHKFVGALAGQGAKKGIFITTSGFTKDAIEYNPRNETKIVLIDGEKLARYMIDYDLGVSIQNTYEIKRIDSDYFEEE